MDQGGDDSGELKADIYTCAGIDHELRQAEILSNVAQYLPNFSNGTVSLEEIRHPYVVVVSQDCDLLRDFDGRKKGDAGTLNEAFLFEARPAGEMRSLVAQGRDIWKNITQNNHERYHYLQAVDAAYDLLKTGLPDIIIDFRRYFGIPTAELYRQRTLSDGLKRRCILLPPYREHLQARAAFYFQRVTLPTPHQTPG